jgi:hypothetical protein
VGPGGEVLDDRARVGVDRVPVEHPGVRDVAGVEAQEEVGERVVVVIWSQLAGVVDGGVEVEGMGGRSRSERRRTGR